MKVLVTGGAGYIGVVLTEQLLNAGFEVRVLDRLYWGRAPLAHLADRIEVVQADVRDIPASAFDGHRCGRASRGTLERSHRRIQHESQLGDERDGDARARARVQTSWNPAADVRIERVDLRRPRR